MKLSRFCLVLFFLLAVVSVPMAYAGDVCLKLTEAEVSAAVGTPLTRDPANPCRFGKGLKSFSIILHSGDGPRFDGYIADAHKEFPKVTDVSGIGSRAIYFGFDLAVKSGNDVFVVAMFLGKGDAEKIALAKAVAQKVIPHL